jgi:hypothetical protein
METFLLLYVRNTTELTLDDINCTIACPTLQELPNEWPIWLLGTHC